MHLPTNLLNHKIAEGSRNNIAVHMIPSEYVSDQHQQKVLSKFDVAFERLLYHSL